MTARNDAATTSAPTRYAVLRFDRLRLLVPQADVRTLESVIDIDRNAPPSGALGRITVDAEHCPVYCLSDALQGFIERPAARRICAVLKHGGELFGLVCAEVTLIRADQLALQRLPHAMSLPACPIGGLVMYADTVAGISSAMLLHAHLRRLAGGLQQEGTSR